MVGNGNARVAEAAGQEKEIYSKTFLANSWIFQVNAAIRSQDLRWLTHQVPDQSNNQLIESEKRWQINGPCNGSRFRNPKCYNLFFNSLV